MQLPFFMEPEPDKIRHKPSPQNSGLAIHDLSVHIPENSKKYIIQWFESNPVRLTISKSRSSKFGDYRAPVKNHPARISVNRDLNNFDFLITLVHEMAHHAVWADSVAPAGFPGIRIRKRNPRPHGKEWKAHFRSLMSPLMNELVFPADILVHLEKHFENSRSFPRSNEQFLLALRKYDPADNFVFVESLEFNSLFSVPSGRVFRKLDKLRKRYRCVCLGNKRIYLFSPLMRVIPVKP